MALEPITRQEQIIAGKELEPITRMERFLKDYGVSNYFGETTVKGDTLTWDGNTEGLVSAGSLYKISDAVPTKTDCTNGATVAYGYNNILEEVTISGEELQAAFMEDGSCSLDFILFIPYDNYAADGIGRFSESGTYFIKTDGMFAKYITIPGYTGFETTTIKRLDEKYMPILTSPNGTKFRLAVNDDGTVTTAEVTE